MNSAVWQLCQASKPGVAFSMVMLFDQDDNLRHLKIGVGFHLNVANLKLVSWDYLANY